MADTADAAVRAAAVAEIPDDDGALAALRELASADEDVRVRRAAAAALERRPTSCRWSRARTRRGPAPGADSNGWWRLRSRRGQPTATRRWPWKASSDQRQLATVAKSAAHETVRTAALGRVHDVKALGSVARHASHGADGARRGRPHRRFVPSSSTSRLKTEHKDAGIAALERAVGAERRRRRVARHAGNGRRRERRTNRSQRGRGR